MSKRNNLLLVEDMVDAVSRIREYTHNLTYSSFLEDQKTIDAVIRNFEIIGEAANRVTNDFKFEYPDIPWRHLADFRNRLIHDYFGVDIVIIWDIIQLELVHLEMQLRKIGVD